MKKLFSIAAILLCLDACNKTSLVECKDEANDEGGKCFPKSKDEQAKLALRENDYDRAIELLEGLIEEEPEEYSRYPLLASVYAVKGGFDLLGAMQSQSAAGGTSLLDKIGGFVPTPATTGDVPYEDRTTLIGKAAQMLLLLPEDHRGDSDEISYARAAGLQLTLYQTAYSVMLMNQFVIPDATNPAAIDVATLQSLTVDDAAKIIDSLSSASANASGQQSEQVKAKIDDALSKIDSQPGETSREKLISYLATKQQTPPTP